MKRKKKPSLKYFCEIYNIGKENKLTAMPDGKLKVSYCVITYMLS